MANIKEFCGYRYNPEKITDLGRVMAPPYDTVSESEREDYYNADEHNIVRVSTGKSYDTDTADNNCYTRAAEYLNDWIREGYIVKESEPCLYLYEQRVKYNDTTFINHGIVALLELTELSEKEVITCEQPSVTTTKERYQLISAINAEVDMINCMYIDPEKSLSALETEYSDKKPDICFTTNEQVIENVAEHRLWLIKDKNTIATIKQIIKTKTLFITDGHNRYSTALKYRNYCMEHDKNYTKESGCNYIMAFCANAYGNRMVQLPVHRMLSTKKKFNEELFVSLAQENFKVEKIIVDTAVDNISEIMKKQIATVRRETRFALYCGEDYFYRLTLVDKKKVKQMLPSKSSAYCELDVTVFNKLIAEDILNIAEEDIDEYVEYTKRSTKGVDAVRKNKAGCLFVLNPVKSEQIREVALSGEVMPDRSIYIFPKPATGVIINKL